MRFTKKREGFNRAFWQGRKNGFLFLIENTTIGFQENPNRFYVTATHSKKDIRYNSLWEKIEFPSLEDAQSFCESFDPSNYAVLGADVTS